MNGNLSNRTRSSAFRFAVTVGLALGFVAAMGMGANEASARKYQDANGNWWCEFGNANYDPNSATGPGNSPTINAGPFNGEPNCTHVCNNYANGTNCANANAVQRNPPTTAPKDTVQAPVVES